MSTTNTDHQGLAAAEPVALAGLIGYQKASIVSRTLIKRSGGTVTLFAFDKGQALSEHTAPFDALVQVLEGQAEFTIGGTRVRAVSGEAVLMPANVPHAVHATEPFKMLLVMLRDVTP